MKHSILTPIGLMVLLAALHASQSVAENLTLPVGGEVSVELVYSEASFSNTLSITSPSAAIAGFCRISGKSCIEDSDCWCNGDPDCLFGDSCLELTGCEVEPVIGLPGLHLGSEKASQRGCRVVLDADPTAEGVQPFAAGSTLEFNMCAQMDVDPECDYLWSSNPLFNPDGATEHVHTTPLHPGKYPGRIFQMEWEDSPHAGHTDFDDIIAVIRVDMDTDGDGLWDDWEEFGIDTNADGVADYDLPNVLPVDLDGDGDTNDPGERVSPDHKDIFLEIDYMDCQEPGSDCPVNDSHNHRPKDAAIAAVVKAFRDAPVLNVDGTSGITLRTHVSNAVAHEKVVAFDAGFNSIKSDPANFGTHNPRRFVFHYALFGHQNSGYSHGVAETPGNDLMVTYGELFVGKFDGDGMPEDHVGGAQEQAATLMHELGHNLGLAHGGNEYSQYKPNYQSVMSYRYDGPSLQDPDGADPMERTIDYSQGLLLTLDETKLNEKAGMGSQAEYVRFTCPNGTYTEEVISATGWVDWNCDGEYEDQIPPRDLNIDHRCVGWGSDQKLDTQPAGDDVKLGQVFILDGPEGTSNRICETQANWPHDEQLRPVNHLQPAKISDFDDWNALRFDHQADGDFQDFVHAGEIIIEEPLEEILPPVADAGSVADGHPNTLPGPPFEPYICTLGETIVLNGSGSSDPLGAIVSFEWDYPDGGEVDATGSTPDFPCVYDVEEVSVSLTVTNDNSLAARDLATIDVNRPPVADAGADRAFECEGNLEATVVLDGSGSNDPDSSPGTNDDIILFEWIENLGLSSEERLGTGETLETSLPVGTHAITLRVTDIVGASDLAEVVVMVVDTTPPVIECNAPDAIVPSEVPISFIAVATDLCDFDPPVELTGFDCYSYSKKGKRVDKTESCVLGVLEDTVTILDSGGVGDRLSWTARAQDSFGNVAETTCGSDVVNPENSQP